MTMHTKVSGTWRETDTNMVKVSGTWREADVYTRVSNTWRTVHENIDWTDSKNWESGMTAGNCVYLKNWGSHGWFIYKYPPSGQFNEDGDFYNSPALTWENDSRCSGWRVRSSQIVHTRDDDNFANKIADYVVNGSGIKFGLSVGSKFFGYQSNGKLYTYEVKSDGTAYKRGWSYQNYVTYYKLPYIKWQYVS